MDASYTQATNQLRVVVKCGRKEKYGQSAATFFNQGIGNDPIHLVGESPDTRTVRYLPSRLNFAIEGTLGIDGGDYDVYLAQYGAGAHNPWFFGSTSLQGVPNKMRDGILGGAYTVRASGYSSFTISKR